MSIIQDKKPLKKVSLLVSDETFTLFKSNQDLAKELKVDLDFNSAFEKWFLKENNKVKSELEARKGKAE